MDITLPPYQGVFSLEETCNQFSFASSAFMIYQTPHNALEVTLATFRNYESLKQAHNNDGAMERIHTRNFVAGIDQCTKVMKTMKNPNINYWASLMELNRQKIIDREFY